MNTREYPVPKNPLAQAPITSLEVKPPNNATSASPIEKGNMTGTPP
ncbi:MAG: hypothetical protein ACJ71O_13420 [Nitrososphaeraceae archaeon]